MKNLKVIEVDSDGITFDDGTSLYSEHHQGCCENHYLSFNDLTLEDFEGLEFDLSGEGFFERVEDFGIKLIPVNGHPIPVPGYGSNNGYYSSNLYLVLSGGGVDIEFNISECQDY